jgi:hypothetical protein
MCTGAHSRCMPCCPARANITCMPSASCCSYGRLGHEHGWGIQDTFLFCPMNTIHTDCALLLSCGRNGTGSAQALCQGLCQMGTCPVTPQAKGRDMLTTSSHTSRTPQGLPPGVTSSHTSLTPPGFISLPSWFTSSKVQTVFTHPSYTTRGWLHPHVMIGVDIHSLAGTSGDVRG